MNPSIRRRLSLGVFVIILLACMLGTVKAYVDTQSEINALLDGQLAQSARALLELSSHELYEQLAYNAGEGLRADKEKPKPQIHPYEQHVVFQIWTTGGRLVVRSPRAPVMPLVDTSNHFLDRNIDGERWRVFAISDDQRGVQVQVGEHYEQRDALSEGVAARLLTPLFVSLPLIVIMIWVWIGRAMRPLSRVTSEISQREPENLRPVSTQDVPLEVKPMVDALNALLNRVHDAYDNIRLFTANAAHELRTPLAALKVHAQVALRSTDPRAQREAMTRVERGTDRATALVEQLLTLTRLEPEAAASEKEMLSLHELAEEQMAELAPAAMRKSIEVSLGNADSGIILGNPDMLRMLIRNLVENAIRYAPAGGRVKVSLMCMAKAVCLRVADSGPGIPEAERHRVFERFYRAGESEEAGTGLGLAIVGRIAELHQAKIMMGESEFQGLQVDVIFPRPQQAATVRADTVDSGAEADPAAASQAISETTP